MGNFTNAGQNIAKSGIGMNSTVAFKTMFDGKKYDIYLFLIKIILIQFHNKS